MFLRHATAILVLTTGISLYVACPGFAAEQYTTKAQVLSTQSEACLKCHTQMHANLVTGWEKGTHAEKGVGCFECHGANATDADAIPDHNGYAISMLVTPNDCGKCHPQEKASFLQSKHAKGGRVLESKANYWGEVVEGTAASIGGCQSCHGSRVQIASDTHQPLSGTWPNSGIGRLNPDGTEGQCSACHQRHDFRMASTRKAETCGRCHLGPDHPQLEVWRESKHGQAFHESNRGIDMDKRPLLLGKDPLCVPNCSTCHMGGTTASETPPTHDVGERLSWDIRSPISGRRGDDWQAKRRAMRGVCSNCHGSPWTRKFYEQYDKSIALYNHKFAGPASEIMTALKAAGKIDEAPFNQKIERDYYQLWHHQGRRARNGAAMQGADYVQWKGFYEVALLFYFEFLPEAERMLPGVTAQILQRPEHRWYEENVSSPEDVKKAIDESMEFWTRTNPEYTVPAMGIAPGSDTAQPDKK